VIIPSSTGGNFECYIVIPHGEEPTSAVVLASAVHGVDADIRALADEFGAEGFIVAAPDLFWRSIPGPLPHGDHRANQRSQPRLQNLRAGESDLADTLAYLRTIGTFNGRAAAMGFCYGGPYAILGPKRLGYAAGISCHGTQMLDFAQELDGLHQPVCVIWGGQDHLATTEVVEAYRGLSSTMSNLETHNVAGAVHGFMMRSRQGVFHAIAYRLAMNRALAILYNLRRSGPYLASGQRNTIPPA
jgi:carboxymethylenebutenolidase